MSLPATDDFNRADGGVGSNWTKTSTSGHDIVSNRCKAAANDYCFSYWNADAFAADHYSQLLAVNVLAYSGPAVRIAAGTDCYVWFLNVGATGTLYRIDNGGFTAIQSSVTTPASSSVVKLTAEGSNLKMWDDGVQVGTTQSDATYATGAAGIFEYGSTEPSGTIDDWEGNNITASVTLTPAIGAMTLAGLVAKMNYAIQMPDEA